MKLSQLRAIVAISDFGNFSEAALNLNLSQSAISHAIAGLEEELGVPLFYRGRHGAIHTPVGEKITKSARQVMQLVEEMQKEANLQKGLAGGQVRLASFRSVATHILPEVISQFRDTYPAIAISIIEHPNNLASVEQALREGQSDIGFTLLPTSDDFITWELMRDEYVAMFPPTFKPVGNHITWEDLSSYPLILPPEDDSDTQKIYAHCQTFGTTIKASYELMADSTIVSMVAQGLGIAILPRLAAEPIPSEVPVYGLPKRLERVIGVAILANGMHVPAVYAFLDTLKSFYSISTSALR